MKNQNIVASPAALEALEARFALRVASRLNDGAAQLPRDISERLRAAREQALERARAVREAEAIEVQADSRGRLTLRGAPGGSERWFKLASLVPIAALIAGLLLIEKAHVNSMISAAAEVDAALLADDVPPTAYSDPGFVEFLKKPRD